MPTYAVGHLKMHDPSWMAEYGPKTGALIQKHGGKFLVRGGKSEQPEGQGPLPDAIFVLEFPSMDERAKAWYNAPNTRRSSSCGRRGRTSTRPGRGS
jgi:uncharacterized protein (DUF1330 family)